MTRLYGFDKSATGSVTPSRATAVQAAHVYSRGCLRIHGFMAFEGAILEMIQQARIL
jgi:hypothetical protein